MHLVEVIYENGVFRPLEPVELAEGATGQVLVEQASSGSVRHEHLPDADGDEITTSPGERAYLLLMEIADLPHASSVVQTDVGVRQDDFLYPKHGRMP